MKRNTAKSIVLPICLWGLFLAAFGAAARPSAADVRNTARIEAQPVGSNLLGNTFGRNFDVGMELNHTGTRVGALLSICNGDGGSLEAEEDCDHYRFVFPDLRVDASKRMIYQGDTLVAKMTFVAGVEPAKGYKLSYEIVKKPLDNGFDQHVGQFVNVYLRHVTPS